VRGPYKASPSAGCTSRFQSVEGVLGGLTTARQGDGKVGVEHLDKYTRFVAAFIVGEDCAVSPQLLPKGASGGFVLRLGVHGYAAVVALLVAREKLQSVILKQPGGVVVPVTEKSLRGMSLGNWAGGERLDGYETRLMDQCKPRPSDYEKWPVEQTCMKHWGDASGVFCSYRRCNT
jgi:hypothetical protein